MYKIAAIGDKDSIYGFASIGLDVFPTDDEAHAARLLRNIVDKGYVVIYITEKLAATLETEIDRYKTEPVPAIVLIPGVSGNTGLGLKNVGKSVEQAVGSDILSD